MQEWIKDQFEWYRDNQEPYLPSQGSADMLLFEDGFLL